MLTDWVDDLLGSGSSHELAWSRFEQAIQFLIGEAEDLAHADAESASDAEDADVRSDAGTRSLTHCHSDCVGFGLRRHLCREDCQESERARSRGVRMQVVCRPQVADN